MNNTILVFQPSISGHELEYVNHLYIGASRDLSHKYIFVLPKEFNEMKSLCSWPNAENIRFHLQEFKKKSGAFSTAFYLSKEIKKCLDLFSPQKIFLISLMRYLPFLPFLVRNGVKVDGIIYKIYLYHWKSSRLVRKLSDTVKYLLLSKSRIFDNIYILNDNTSALYLNKLYKSSRFKFLPDPFISLKFNKLKDDAVQSYKIPSDKIVLLHFGGITKRKGTLEILEAFKLLPLEVRRNYFLIFAGRVYDDIRNEFYLLIKELQIPENILVLDEFCSFDLIHAFCEKADYILLPYTNTSQSSGLIGYAALHNVPIIGPANGLVGKIIKRFHLGVTLNDVTSIGLSSFLSKEDIKVPTINGAPYIHVNSLDNFLNVIFRNL